MSILHFKELRNFEFTKHSQDLFNYLEKIKLKDRQQISSEGAYVGVVEFFKRGNFIFIKVYKEYQRDASFFNGNPKRLNKRKNIEGEYRSILITNQGHILHEVSQFFHDDDIENLILNFFKNIGLHNVSIHRTNNFSLLTMRTFYKSAKKIKTLIIKEIGEVKPNPAMPPEEVERAIQDMAQGSNVITLDSGKDKNLKDSQLVNGGLAKRSNIEEVRGKDEEGDMFTINSNGTILAHLPEDDEKRASKLYRFIEKILGLIQ